MKTMRRGAWLLGLAVVGATGCAGSPKSGASAPSSTPPPEAAPAIAGAPADRAESEPAAAAQRAAPHAAPPSAPAPSTPGAYGARDASRRASRARAGAELDTAQRQLDVAAGDCTSACRALASMERATAHLCELADDEQDRATCDDAKARVRQARGRVLTSCGGCPGGPSLEPNAPIPSR